MKYQYQIRIRPKIQHQDPDEPRYGGDLIVLKLELSTLSAQIASPSLGHWMPFFSLDELHSVIADTTAATSFLSLEGAISSLHRLSDSGALIGLLSRDI